MSEYRLDEAFRIMEAEGVEAHRVVVRGEGDHECKLPAGANAGQVLGVTLSSQPREGRFVAVRRAGICRALAGGAIARGAAVAAGDDQGRVRQVPLPEFNFGEVASNNAVVVEWLIPEMFALTSQVELAAAEASEFFSWSFAAGKLRLLLSADGGGAIVETPTTLIASVEADAELSKLIRVRNATGSSGAGTMAAETAHAGNIQDLLHPIGTAEQEAAQEGDLIDVLLRP